MSTDYQTNLPTSSIKPDISKLTDLPIDIIQEIFNYLTLGGVYYSFYYINNKFKNLINNCFSSLNFMLISHYQFLFYYENIASKNREHCEKISSLKLLNKKPFCQIERLAPIIYLYKNLKKLYLYSTNENQLQILPLIIPNLSELYIINKQEKISNIDWLSYLKNLQILSIDLKTCGLEINRSLRSLSNILSSITITLSSAYDFYAFLSLVPSDTLRHLDITLYDSEFSYIKTFRSPISLASKLISFSFNMSLIPMTKASCLYDIIRFVSTTLRRLKSLTILCRFADGVLIDEEKFRNYLSHCYSINNYELFIEMKDFVKPIFNQFIFDETTFSYPFWLNKDVHVNSYRNKDNELKHIRIYTLPLVSKITNLLNLTEDNYKLITSSLNIHQFALGEEEEEEDSIYHFADDITLTPNRIYSSSNISLLFHLSHLSSLEVIRDEMRYFLELSNSMKAFCNIRKLQFNDWPIYLMRNTQIFSKFPCLQSFSVNNVDTFDMLKIILQKVLVELSNKLMLIHLHIRGLVFNEICPEHFDEEQSKINFRGIFFLLFSKINSYDVSFNEMHRSIDIWY